MRPRVWKIMQVTMFSDMSMVSGQCTMESMPTVSSKNMITVPFMASKKKLKTLKSCLKIGFVAPPPLDLILTSISFLKDADVLPFASKIKD